MYNLPIYWHLARQPGDTSGEIALAGRSVIPLSLYECLAALVAVALVACFSSSWFAHGAVLGMVAMALAHLL